jgi:hypothetical protein
MSKETIWIIHVIVFALIGAAYVVYDWYRDKKK